jgi:7-cyano-7-deazaguanine synthase
MGGIQILKSAILLSGGMDSMALAYWRRPAYAFTVNYGQAAFEGELRVSKYVCKKLKIKHIEITADCANAGSGKMAHQTAAKKSVTPEWWPFRNQMLISIAAMQGIKCGVAEIIIGAVKSDRVYADGTARFFALMDKVVSLQEGGIRVSAPALRYSTAGLVRASEIPYDLICLAHSCNLSAIACGQCRSCVKRRESMESLGYPAF